MQKTERYNLTQGGILQKLLTLALPIMGTQLVQMLYNLTDMFWLGRLGSEAVAASGTVGLYMWLSMALYFFGEKGAEIGVSQSLGKGDEAAARAYTQSSLALSLGLGLLFAAVMFFFRGPLIAFFNIREQGVVQDAEAYLAIVSIGFPFNYLFGAGLGAFTGSGNSRTPFYITAAALFVNVVLDPLLIFPAGLGIRGAAIATVTAQIVGCLLILLALKRYRHPAFASFRLFVAPRSRRLKHIFGWAAPIVIESFFFTLLAMITSRFVAAFGAGAIATQRIGSQVESLSWLIAGGFASAFTAYVGQNFGAGKWRRIYRGFAISSAAMAVWGLFVTAIIFFGSHIIFALFLPGDTAVIAMGVSYMRILALCQLFGCLGPLAAGAWRGLGRSLPPSVISIAANLARVALCWYLSARTPLGLNGIWWGITIGAITRDGITYAGYALSARRLPQKDS